MGDSLGNYEPRDLKPQSGPGEGGLWDLSRGEACVLQALLFVSFRCAGDRLCWRRGQSTGVNQSVWFQHGRFGQDLHGSTNQRYATGRVRFAVDSRIRSMRSNWYLRHLFRCVLFSFRCKRWIYPDVQYLPTAAVILVFYDEGFSVLLRTVHSVINTSPKELLKEIILIDDGSSDRQFLHSPSTSFLYSTSFILESLMEPLEKYIARWNGLVKLFRTGKRVGLIEARTLGAQKSTADVIVILDAHCECVRIERGGGGRPTKERHSSCLVLGHELASTPVDAHCLESKGLGKCRLLTESNGKL